MNSVFGVGKFLQSKLDWASNSLCVNTVKGMLVNSGRGWGSCLPPG